MLEEVKHSNLVPKPAYLANYCLAVALASRFKEMSEPLGTEQNNVA
jgi:hypothetical protein